MRTTSSVCGGSATGGAEGDNSSSEDGDVDGREDSHSQQVAIPSVPEVLRAPQPSALNRKRIRLILISIISQIMSIMRKFDRNNIKFHGNF